MRLDRLALAPTPLALAVRGERQLEGERRPDAGGRGDPDPAAHVLDELAADVEPEAGSADALLHERVDAVELLEDPLLLLPGDPEALVAHGEPRVAVVGVDPDLDVAAVRRVLRGVLDQVYQHLPSLR